MIILVDNKQSCGVYRIKNIIDDKCYIGSTTGILKKRCCSHKTKLKHNKHQNDHLQNAWNKHGENNFEFSLVELCDHNSTFVREQYYIDTLHPEYNIIQFAGGGIKGFKHKEKTKKLISELQTGENHWGYKGEFVFYNKEIGYYNGSIVSFIKKFDYLTEDAVYRLCKNKLLRHKNWICLGNYDINFIYPINIEEIYRNKLNRHKTYYAFYKNSVDNFIGTVGEFIKKYNYRRNNICGIVNGNRLSSNSWICLGKCNNEYKFPDNICDIYNEKLSVNLRIKDISNKKFTFDNNVDIFTGTINEFCKKFSLNVSCVKRICKGIRKNHKGWKIKND